MGAVNPAILEQLPTLTPQQQEVVLRLIEDLKKEDTDTEITLDKAYRKFVSRHRKLLELLAQ